MQSVIPILNWKNNTFSLYFSFLPITFSLKRSKIDKHQIRCQNFFVCKVRLCQSELVFLKKVNYISKDLLKTFYRYRCKIWSTHKSLVSGVKIASQASIWSRLLSVNWTFFIFFSKSFFESCLTLIQSASQSHVHFCVVDRDSPSKLILFKLTVLWLKRKEQK
jgi:hypothetical protein